MIEKLKALLKECISILDSMTPSIGYGEKPAPKYVWGVIVPHTKNSPGASSKEKKINEYEYGLKLASYMPIPRETRDEGGVSLAAKRLKIKGCNASLESHLNAFNSTAKGFEILVLENDSESIRVAEIMAENFKAKYPARTLRHSNGVKKIKSGDRGYLMNETMQGICNVEAKMKCSTKQLQSFLGSQLLHLEMVNYYSEKE